MTSIGWAITAVLALTVVVVLVRFAMTYGANSRALEANRCPRCYAELYAAVIDPLGTRQAVAMKCSASGKPWQNCPLGNRSK